ncbi:MAG: C69 family dipeptidase [Clostridia bacterium]|nr:C69 family dipeptidase [Clostridia bacterium]
MSKKFFAIVIAMILCLTSVSAFACTALYVGADLTEDGSNMFARSEDISNSYNKLFYVSPAGNHKAGDFYKGCYGFTYTFTKDSYSYTAFSDDNGAGVNNVCPDCGETHVHTPYEAAGTNEMGVSVSATETIGASDKNILALDPKTDLGIEEAEIVTVLLSESATAKEAVDLLLSIYDNYGCAGGSGVFIADNTEVWYIENITGTQYVALKLPSSLVFAQPNMSVIGLIDLDDKENVIASAKLIEIAEANGTYVGDKAANTINYVASYSNAQAINARMVEALPFFSAENAKEEYAYADFTISNVDAEGNIVPLYTNIKLDRAFGVDDFADYYHLSSIGSTGNLQIHIFQVFAEDSLTDTVEWVAMDHGKYSVFVPYYPMLTTDTYAAYKTSTAKATFAEQLTEDADVAYASTSRKRTAEGVVTLQGFKVLPANWAEGYYWTMDALSNICESNGLTAEQLATVNAKLAELQNDCYAAYADMQAQVAAAETAEAAAQIATEISAKTAAAVHAACVELVNGIK